MIGCAFDTRGDRGEKFVGDSACAGGLLLKEVGRPEESHFIAFTARDICDIKETHVHAYRANYGYLLASDKDTAVAVAKMAVETVSIAYGNDGYTRRPGGYPATVVAHTIAERNFFNLGDFGFKGADRLEMALDRRQWRDAIKANAKAHHVHLSLWEPLNTRGVEEMAEDAGDVERRTEVGAPTGETVYLGMGEIVLPWFVGTSQMGED